MQHTVLPAFRAVVVIACATLPSCLHMLILSGQARESSNCSIMIQPGCVFVCHSVLTAWLLLLVTPFSSAQCLPLPLPLSLCMYHIVRVDGMKVSTTSNSCGCTSCSYHAINSYVVDPSLLVMNVLSLMLIQRQHLEKALWI